IPFVSCVLAGATSMASGMPCLSTATWILTPRIFLPPSMPRVKQLGVERQERLAVIPGVGAAGGEGAGGGAAGAAVDDQGAGSRRAAAGKPQGAAQPVEQPAP